MAWNVIDMQRRCALYRFAPATMGYGWSYFGGGGGGGGRRRRRGERVDDDRIKTMWPTKFYDGLDDAERAVLEPPYANRPNILEDGTVEITRRGDRKRQHNREVFKTKYF